MSEKREATFQERATWGDCPVCNAGHGEWCRFSGLFAVKPDGSYPVEGEGAHLGRLQNAPKQVQLVAV